MGRRDGNGRILVTAPGRAESGQKNNHTTAGYFFDSGGEDGNRTRLNRFAGGSASLQINKLSIGALNATAGDIPVAF
jgi:hypothetical protein